MNDKKIVVEWYSPNTGFRTGIYVRTIEAKRGFGLIEIAPTLSIPRKLVRVRPDNVRFPVTAE